MAKAVSARLPAHHLPFRNRREKRQATLLWTSQVKSAHPARSAAA